MKIKLFFFLLIPFLGISQVQIGQNIDGKVAGDESGGSISISSDGSIIAIGSEFNSDNGYHSGHVRVFKNTSGVWTQIGQDIYGENAADRFGTSVSLSADGTIVAIGANNNGSAGNWAGHVRVFKNILGVWTQIGQDIEGEVNQYNQGGQSGSSISLSGDGTIVAIGTPQFGTPYVYSGHVKVFKYTSGVWTQIGSNIVSEFDGDLNGTSISISSNGNVLAIGAPTNDGNGTDSGSVRIYQNINNNWTKIGNDIDGEASGDQSGSSVSISGDGSVVAIGSPFYNMPNGLSRGQVRVYKNYAGSWVQIGSDIEGQIGTWSGNRLALSTDGNTLVVGSLNLQYAKVYRNISQSWIQIGTIGTIQGHYFGLALSADGNIGAIGSPLGTSKGTVQIYDLSTLSSKKIVLDNFSIYPNPASDILNISLESNLVFEKAVFYNNLGQIVKESNSEIIDVSSLAKGIYFVEVTTDQGKATKKVIVK